MIEKREFSSVIKQIVALPFEGVKVKRLPLISPQHPHFTWKTFYANICSCLLNSFSANPLALACALLEIIVHADLQDNPSSLVHQLVQSATIFMAYGTVCNKSRDFVHLSTASGIILSHFLLTATWQCYYFGISAHVVDINWKCAEVKVSRKQTVLYFERHLKSFGRILRKKKQIIHIHFKKFKIAPNPIRNAIKAQLAYDN